MRERSAGPPISGQPTRVATPLREVAALFLKLGTTTFGGPAAHIAMMHDEVVGRRRWLSREQFLDFLGATNLIPGPNSTEMAIHIGYLRAGWPGLLVAGTCFILPATAIMAAIAALYTRFGTLPQSVALLYGVKPVVIAVIVQALWRLAGTAVRTMPLAILGLVAVALNVLGISELVVLFGAGIVAALAHHYALNRDRGARSLVAFGAPAPLAPLLHSGAGAGAAAAASASVSLLPLFLIFLKVGAILFGSGYVLLAFLRADLVTHRGWLTEAQLLDATAVGQLTPGPVFTTATFVGYVLAGPVGALVATVGIFLPAFVFVALSGPLVPRLRRSPLAGAFLDGVNIGSVALMAVVTCQLARTALVDTTTCVLGIASAALLIWWRVNSAWLVVAGAAIGLLTGLRI